MNYNQYLEDYWPEEKQNDATHEQDQTYYFDGRVSCIDRQIAELEARRYAMIHGYCFTGYYGTTKPYLDPYNLDKKEEK
jgi:hypothetical protein